MPRLVIANPAATDITVGNSDGFGRAFTILAAGMTIDLTDAHFQKALPQLNALVTAGKITFTVAQDPAVKDEHELYGPGKARLLQFLAPAAKGTTNVHAALAGNAAVAFPGAFTNPAIPRNLRCVFAASYDGGNVTVTGTDQYDRAQTELFTAVAGTTVVGTKIFKTVTAAVRSAVGATANTVSIGTGDKLGILANVVDSFGMLMADDVVEAVTVDAAVDGFTPTTVPDGAVNYKLLVNL